MKIGFYSCMSGMPWGGSEELWYRSARSLLQQGHQVAVNYRWWPNESFQIQKLKELGAEVYLRERPPGFWRKKTNDVRTVFSRKTRPHPPRPDGRQWLRSIQPDCVLITIGYHPDPINVAQSCAQLGIPYAINVQCASNSFFIHGDRMEDYRRWYRGADRVFFVSPENQHKVEMNLATQLTNGEIVANPFNTRLDTEVGWPADASTLRLACVGRIHFQSKGQDILVDVMRQEKWRNRNLTIHFFGHDQGNRKQLEELIRIHNLGSQLKLEGFVNDISQIWTNHHGLVLPSRYEGAPLVVVEAMMCHRLVITTDIGRNRELIDDGESGFIAPVATAELFDAAMERAWQQRTQWQQMGERAGQHVRQRFSLDPIGEFSQKLIQLAQIKKG